jgi:hypothetical protein
MPNGVTHEQTRKQLRLVITMPVSIISALVVQAFPLRTELSLFIGIGIPLGYELGSFCTPDWDCTTATNDESRLMDIPVIGGILFGLSSMYGAYFRRHHRSWMTHFPFISTTLRYILLFWWAWWGIYWSTWDLAWLVFVFIGGFIGLSCSDAVHWFLDLNSKL